MNGKSTRDLAVHEEAPKSKSCLIRHIRHVAPMSNDRMPSFLFEEIVRKCVTRADSDGFDGSLTGTDSIRGDLASTPERTYQKKPGKLKGSRDAVLRGRVK